ncbi:MAG: hypothetical protein Q4D35_01825 [Ruminococcus sp.]|nr:hypothetical protein [Ruminococcus sp.]
MWFSFALYAVPLSTLKSIMYGITKNSGVVIIKMLCDAFEIILAEFFGTDLFNRLEQEIE